MHIIRHRRNTIAELRDTPPDLGIEVDVRSEGDRLIINHDPFRGGEDLLEWLDEYRHGTLILNVKEEGLEDRLLDEMAKRNMRDFFFLDQSFPFLIRTAARGEHRCAVRVSEFEAVDTALGLAGKIDWVWVDCFSRFPLNGRDAGRLRDAGFLLCLVSPELQGRDDPAEIAALRDMIAAEGIVAEAVCTKKPELWR